MKNFMGILCLLIILVSCDISLPQSFSIKGNPGVYVSLGNPLHSTEGNNIEYLLSADGIKEMMSGGDGNVKVYEFQGSDSDALSFLVQYPITEMKLDLQAFIQEAMSSADINYVATIPNIPDTAFPPGGVYLIPGNQIVSLTPGDPLFSIDLGEMGNLLSEVSGGPGRFGIEIECDTSVFNNKLQVRIPALGIGASNINDYKSQDTDSGGGSLKYTNANPLMLNPQVTKKIDIYIKMTGPCHGTIKPKIIFNWETAKVKTKAAMGGGEEGGIHGEYEIKNSLGELFNSNDSTTEFKTVHGYMYVGGLGDNKATLSLKLSGNPNEKIPDDRKLLDKPRPNFVDPFTDARPISSLKNDLYVDLADLFNNQESSKLKYKIDIDEIPVSNPGDVDKLIYADLVIVLVMDLKVTPTPQADIHGEYVKLDMGLGKLSASEGAKVTDMFGRTSGDDGGILSSINNVKIIIDNVDITVFEEGRLAILVTNKNQVRLLDLYGDNLSLEIEDFSYPFVPKFEVLFKKDSSTDLFAPVKILHTPEPKFYFTMAIEAKADINVTMDF